MDAYKDAVLPSLAEVEPFTGEPGTYPAPTPHAISPPDALPDPVSHRHGGAAAPQSG